MDMWYNARYNIVLVYLREKHSWAMMMVTELFVSLMALELEQLTKIRKTEKGFKKCQLTVQ